MGRIKYLQPEFEGTGSTKAFKYTKLLSSYGIFCYEVTSPEGWVHYDIFKPKFVKPHYQSKDTTFDLIQRYPHDEAFGFYAWNYRSLRKALEKFFSLYDEAEDAWYRQMAKIGVYSATRFENGYDE